MSFDIGSIGGELNLDTNKFSTPLREAVAQAVSGSEKLEAALTRPFGPARDATGRFTSSVEELNSSIRQTDAASSSLKGTLGSIASTAVGTALGSMFSSAVSGATSLIGTLESVGIQSVKLAAQAESTSLALTTMIGDSGRAKTLLNDLRTFANSTPFEFPELANAAKQLLAMGIDASDVVETLRKLGDVSSGLGQPIGEMSYLFGQIRSQGRAMTQDLNQFAGRGVPIYSELAKVLKTNELGVRSLAEQGRISFGLISQAFTSMTAEGGKFFNMTASQAETAQGLFSTLQDSIGDVEKQIGEALTSGTDGKSLLKEITAEVDKLKPSIVSLGVSLAAAFKTALPAIQTTIDYLQVVLDKIGLIDLNKLNGNPYASATKDKIDAIRGASDDDTTYSKLSDIQQGVTKGAAEAAASLKGLSTWDTHEGGIEKQSADLVPLLENSQKLLATLQARRAAGGTISPEEFQHAKDEVAGSLKGLSLLQEAINRTLPDLSTLHGDVGGGTGVERGNAALAQIRAAQVAAQKAIDDLSKTAKDKRDKLAADADRLQTGNWASSPIPSSSSPDASAGSGGSNVGTGGGSGGYDVARTVGDGQVAALKASGKEVEAELLKARQQRDRELARIDQQYGAGGLSVKDSVNAARAVTTEYEAAVKSIQDRAAREKTAADERQAREQSNRSRQLATELERIDAYKTQAIVANLKGQGRAFDAEMVSFDAAWKKRIEDATTGEERYSATVAYEAERRQKIREAEQNGTSGKTLAPTIAELQRRVRDAKAGSGERELARLDLREGLGKHLTADEDARRDRLGQRFNVPRLNLDAFVPPITLPSPMAVAMRAMTPRSQTNSSQSANLNVAPNIYVDEKKKKLTQLVREAVIPEIDRRIGRFAYQLRDLNHANAIFREL